MTRRSVDNQWINVFEIKETTTHPNKAHTIYKVVHKLFPRNSIESVSEIVVWKRFNDFKQLHKALQRLHQNLHLKGTFPKLPESKIFGRFKHEVIEERKNAALQLLEFAANFTPLLTSSHFVKFFENGEFSIDSECDVLPKPLQPRKLNECENAQCSKSDSSEDSNGGELSPTYQPNKHDSQKSELLTQLSDFDPLKSNKETGSSWELLDESWLFVTESAVDAKSSNAIENHENILQLPHPFSDFPESSSAVSEGEISREENENKSSLNVMKEQLKDVIEIPNSVLTNSDTYLIDAATLISQAQQHENKQEFEAAFESYKCAVGILLQGVQNESDEERKDLVRRKTFKYLSRAEVIRDEYLNNSDATNSKWAPDSPYKLMSQSVIPLKAENSVHCLKQLKVCEIIGRVQLVTNIVTNEKFIVKVLCKPPNLTRTPLFPTDVPNMVKLYRIYETDYAYFLLLHYVAGGRLWDRVYGCNKKLSPCADCTFSSLLNGDDTGFTLSSCHSLFSPSQESSDEFLYEKNDGKLSKLDSCFGSISSVDSIGIDEDTTCKSYVDLCASYASLRSKFEPGCPELNSNVDNKKAVINSKYESKIECGTVQSSQKFKFGMSLESLGISNLLQRAKAMIKNSNEMLHTIKISENTHGNGNRNGCSLKLSKSELNLSKPKASQIEEVFHQFENNCLVQYGPIISEDKVRKWLMQIITALDHLHSLGLYYIDLNPVNILIEESADKVLLTYKCKIIDKEYIKVSHQMPHSIYIAPEVFSNISTINHQVDWWSVGVIAYELITSRSFKTYHQNGTSINCDLIYFPPFVSAEAKDLITELLQQNPKLRLGRYGTEDIKTHPFFLKLE
ncbi:ribosomal protein S6 kinase delta-1-like protein [Dinothrombium tinctorium]|uniref:Ribosomal protein S6 kinase delta-1-like protein n=1 Tax=Dinothrombium tinctorium TaxID=1965070 RepID=A0A443R168_9ACAR|nr:ribosomal protein S6 kinase delta-1-like protein [Dinothrombium tinctorium]